MTVEVERRHYTVTFALLAAAGVSYALLQSLVAPALPNIQHAVNTSETSVSWLMTAYLLCASVATPILGRLGDMFGKEKILVIVMVILAVGTFLSAIANSMNTLMGTQTVSTTAPASGRFANRSRIARSSLPPKPAGTSIGPAVSIANVSARGAA